MTTAAWIMLAITWTIVIGFTSRFFWKVFVTPVSPEREAQMRDGILEKDA
jgi:hypothetical protein